MPAKLLTHIVNQLQASFEEIESCALITQDGFTVASASPKGFDELRLSAIAAVLLSTGKQAATHLDYQDFQRVIVECQLGQCLILPVNHELIFALIFQQPTNAKVFYEQVNRTIDNVKNALTILDNFGINTINQYIASPHISQLVH